MDKQEDKVVLSHSIKEINGALYSCVMLGPWSEHNMEDAEKTAEAMKYIIERDIIARGFEFEETSSYQ